MDKKQRNELSEKISVAISSILKGSHNVATEKVEKHIREASRDLAKKFLKAKKEIIKKAEVKKAEVKKVVKKVQATAKARKIAKPAIANGTVNKPGAKRAVKPTRKRSN